MSEEVQLVNVAKLREGWLAHTRALARKGFDAGWDACVEATVEAYTDPEIVAEVERMIAAGVPVGEILRTLAASIPTPSPQKERR